MSNRLGWFLILLSFFVIGFIYLLLFFLPEKTTKKIIINNSTLEEKKEITFSEIERKETQKTNEQKIKDLKENNKYFKVFELNAEKYYFSIVNNSLHLNLDNKLIWVFELVNNKDLLIEKFYSSNDIYIIIWNDKYIYNRESDTIYKLDLNIDINYVKESENKYLINTKKGTFIYSINNNKIEYFNFFSDFIYYNNWYLGILNINDKLRLNNLWITFKKENIIYYYNPISKEKKVIYETNKRLNKIYLKWIDIIFEDIDSKLYKLENYTK